MPLTAATTRRRRNAAAAVVEPPADTAPEPQPEPATPAPAAAPAKAAARKAPAARVPKPSTKPPARAAKKTAGNPEGRTRRPAQTVQGEPAASAAGATTAEAQTSSEAPAGAVRTAVIPFRGRQVEVKLPTIEQLTVFQRTANRFAAVKDSDQSITAQEATNLYDRALRVVTALVVDRTVVTWIEDMLLDGEIELADCTPLITEAVPALKERVTGDGNRATRRAARLGR